MVRHNQKKKNKQANLAQTKQRNKEMKKKKEKTQRLAKKIKHIQTRKKPMCKKLMQHSLRDSNPQPHTMCVALPLS